MLPQGVPDRPEQGHRFRINVAMRGASSVRGIEHSHADTDYESPFREVVVRASSLSEALRIAARLPLVDWLPRDEWPAEDEP